jgi:hypothetical protein
MFSEVESVDIVFEIAPRGDDWSRKRWVGGEIVGVYCDRHESAENK